MRLDWLQISLIDRYILNCMWSTQNILMTNCTASSSCHDQVVDMSWVSVLALEERVDCPDIWDLVRSHYHLDKIRLHLCHILVNKFLRLMLIIILMIFLITCLNYIVVRSFSHLVFCFSFMLNFSVNDTFKIYLFEFLPQISAQNLNSNIDQKFLWKYLRWNLGMKKI